jgi:hypothetical protein
MFHGRIFYNYYILVLAQSLYRTCIPVETEPTLNSSSCYPLVNFIRPFCQNHGVTLPNYVFKTTYDQNDKNDQMNKDYDGFVRLGAPTISRILRVDIATIRKCMRFDEIYLCHHHFPRCDRTQSVFKEQMICRESYVGFIHVCHKLWEIYVTYFTIRSPEKKKLYNSLQLQPYRNAGDSPECWYFNRFANYTGNIRNQRGIRSWWEDLPGI